MRRILAIMTACALAFAVAACTKKQKDMTIEDFAKIDLEVAVSDQKPETIETIAKKHGYTAEQYEEFSKIIEKSSTLQEKLGDIRLGEQKSE